MAFLDLFVDTVGTAVESRPPDTAGTAWTLQHGSTSIYEIQYNGTVDKYYIRTIGTADNDVLLSDDLGTPDHRTIVRLGEIAFITHSTNFQEMPIGIRVSDRDNAICWRWFGTGTTGSRISRLQGGSYTDLLSVSGAFSWLRPGFVMLEAEGDTIRLFQQSGETLDPENWTIMGSVTESFNNTATRQGLFKRGGNLGNTNYISRYETSIVGGAPPAARRRPLIWVPY